MTDDASLSGFGLYEDLIEEENHVSKHQVSHGINVVVD